MGRISYRGYRFPPEIIQRAVWLYFRFTLSFWDVEDLLAERGIEVSYETIRQWVMRFGPAIARDLRSQMNTDIAGARQALMDSLGGIPLGRPAQTCRSGRPDRVSGVAACCVDYRR